MQPTSVLKRVEWISAYQHIRQYQGVCQGYFSFRDYSSKISLPIRVGGFHHHSSSLCLRTSRTSFSLVFKGISAFDSGMIFWFNRKQNKCEGLLGSPVDSMNIPCQVAPLYFPLNSRYQKFYLFSIKSTSQPTTIN